MTEAASFKDYLKLHLIVFIWGFAAILAKLIEMPTAEVVFYRTLLAAIGLALLLKFRKRAFNIGRAGILRTLGTGTLIGAHWVLFFEAARVANVSVSLAGLATVTFWTSLAEPLFNSRKVRIFEVGIGLVVILGLYIVFQFEFDNALGLTLGIISALLAAIFSVLNAGIAKKYNPYMITFYEMVGAFGAVALFTVFYEPVFLGEAFQVRVPTAEDLLYIFILAAVCTVYAYSDAVELMKRISAFTVNLTINLEPVYGILMALAIFGESEEMSSGFYLGTFIILLAVFLYPVINRRMRKRAERINQAGL
ncbi:MAG: EamA family transporter [Roseivirga sp.]|nr:EamA family transporter [Roseivirga sp.]